MRRDIEINTDTHDLVLHNQGHFQQYSFSWLPDTDQSFLKGEVLLPSDFWEKQKYEGVAVHIPYTPVYKPVQIRFNKNGVTSDWQNLQVMLYGIKNTANIKASELVTVDINENYILQLNSKDSNLYVYSGNVMDVGIRDANYQNRDMLLQCIPSNSYRYPISGVGLVNYLNSNMIQSGLSERLRSEFEKDGVIVKKAEFDSDTGELNMALKFIEE